MMRFGDAANVRFCVCAGAEEAGRARRGDVWRKPESAGSLQQEIDRLRQELTHERSEKMSLEQTASSLENALQFSKKKVNEQRETITRLEGDVRKAQSLAPCLKEILSGMSGARRAHTHTPSSCARANSASDFSSADGACAQSPRGTTWRRRWRSSASSRDCRLSATRLSRCRTARTRIARARARRGTGRESSTEWSPAFIIIPFLFTRGN